jgi:hypothetical protein
MGRLLRASRRRLVTTARSDRSGPGSDQMQACTLDLPCSPLRHRVRYSQRHQQLAIQAFGRSSQSPPLGLKSDADECPTLKCELSLPRLDYVTLKRRIPIVGSRAGILRIAARAVAIEYEALGHSDYQQFGCAINHLRSPSVCVALVQAHFRTAVPPAMTRAARRTPGDDGLHLPG